jgi:hypothetical protein
MISTLGNSLLMMKASSIISAFSSPAANLSAHGSFSGFQGTIVIGYGDHNLVNQFADGGESVKNTSIATSAAAKTTEAILNLSTKFIRIQLGKGLAHFKKCF